MYQIYIRHFLAPTGRSNAGSLVENEELLCELPSVCPEEEMLIDPKVKNEMGKAGSFEFSIDQSNPWFASFQQLTTIMRVKYDDETIFYGRVLAIDMDMWGTKRVHCEGALAFLLDTMFEATKEEERIAISMEQYVRDLIDSHNGLTADEPNKHFSYGEIPGYYSGSVTSEMRPENGGTRKYGSSSWTSTMNCLEDLTSKYGGYWRARYNDSDGKVYLDWLRNYFSPSVINQPLELAENIINMSNTVDVNGIFTVLIPEGKKNGKSLYLDDCPKTIKKVPVTSNPENNTPVGPGFTWINNTISSLGGNENGSGNSSNP